MMIVNDDSSIVNKLEDLLTDDARSIIYDRHVFIVQATGVKSLTDFQDRGADDGNPDNDDSSSDAHDDIGVDVVVDSDDNSD